jgi:imidazolonepropionase-like amidohydrolase
MRHMRLALACMALAGPAPADAQQTPAFLLKPARVYNGMNSTPHEGWYVLVQDDRISVIGLCRATPGRARVIDLPGNALMPGLIEGHDGLFLHARNETS